MSIRVAVDGAKGTGKSTLCEMLTHHYNARHEYVSYKHVYTLDEYHDIIHALPIRDLIMERGALSSWIYTWTRNGVMTCDDWSKPLVSKDIVQFVNEFDAFVILYASNTAILQERVNERIDAGGRGYTLGAVEQNDLVASNALFRAFADILISYGCTNIVAIDVCREQSIDEIHQCVLDVCKRNGAEPVPFDPHDAPK